ncbi:helix-turn-helix domain-containing protein [Cellulomonas hominis]
MPDLMPIVTVLRQRPMSQYRDIVRQVRSSTQLGAAIRDQRHARGWTQAELARRASVSRQLVVGVERGTRPAAELWRVLMILRALDLAIELVDAPPAAPRDVDELLAQVIHRPLAPV